MNWNDMFTPEEKSIILYSLSSYLTIIRTEIAEEKRLHIDTTRTQEELREVKKLYDKLSKDFQPM